MEVGGVVARGPLLKAKRRSLKLASQAGKKDEGPLCASCFP